MEKKEYFELLDEFNSLNDKITRLREFILKGENIDNLNKDLLISQLKAMEAYISILSIRIGLNSPKENELAKSE